MLCKKLYFGLLIIFIAPSVIQAESPQRINVGYFEAGKYPVHAILRDEYFKQLEQILPEDYIIVTVPEGFRSAEWKRDNCRSMAKQLSRMKHLDLIIAVGPWVVHDLLDAGCETPILGLHQFDPSAEGLLDSLRKPVVDNLTVTQPQGKIYKDLVVFSNLVRIKRLGLLYFPSADEKEKIYNRFKEIGQNLGFEIVIGEGDDNYGTFAFFKAFNNLGKRVDAVYLPPMWGMDETKLSEFLKMLKRKRIPAFSYEGNILIDKGAFATNDYFGIISEARFNAVKTVDILKGKTLSSLPVILKTNDGLAVNLETAAGCKIDLPEDIVINYHTIDRIVSDETNYYTLNDAISRAVLQNPGYLAQYEALQAAAVKAERAYTDYFPKLYGTASYQYLSDELTGGELSLVDNNQFHSSINLDQTIFSLGTIKEIKLAAKLRDLMDYNLTQSQIDLELGVSLVYIECMRHSEILRILKNNRKLTEHNLELAIAKNLYEQSDTLDIIHLENERYRLSLLIIEARKILKLSKISLNRLFNLPGDEPFVLDSTLFTEKNFIGKETPLFDKIQTESQQSVLTELLLSNALARNPRLVQQDLSIKIQNDLLDLNKTRYFPEVGFRGSLNYNDRLKNSSIYKEEKSSWMVGMYLRWPLFLGGDRIKERSQTKAKLNQAEYQRDELSLELMERIHSEFKQLTSFANMMTPAYQSKKRAAIALEMAVTRFMGSKISILDLLRIQQRSIEADFAFINSRYNYYKTMAKIVNISGITTNDNYSNFVEEFHRLVQY